METAENRHAEHAMAVASPMPHESGGRSLTERLGLPGPRPVGIPSVLVHRKTTSVCLLSCPWRPFKVRQMMHEHGEPLSEIYFRAGRFSITNAMEDYGIVEVATARRGGFVRIGAVLRFEYGFHHDFADGSAVRDGTLIAHVAAFRASRDGGYTRCGPYGVGSREDGPSRLNTRPARIPCNASAAPSERHRTIRVRFGSLLLHRVTLSSTTPRRFNRRTGRLR
jgi:hypothetical protein